MSTCYPFVYSSQALHNKNPNTLISYSQGYITWSVSTVQPFSTGRRMVSADNVTPIKPNLSMNTYCTKYQFNKLKTDHNDTQQILSIKSYHSRLRFKLGIDTPAYNNIKLQWLLSHQLSFKTVIPGSRTIYYCIVTSWQQQFKLECLPNSK
jgi:hypothetical protein